MHYLGLDVGFGYTKAMDDKKAIVFPSVVSPPVEISFKPSWQNESDRLHHLAVTLEEKTYFVGHLALNQGRFAHATLDRVRTETPEFKLLFLAAISLFVESPEEAFSVITGLPVDDFEDRKVIEKTLRGRFDLSVAGEDVSFVIKNLTVIPQPCGAFMDLLYAPEGLNEEYMEGPVGIIDIGYKTTDFVLMRSGEYAHKLSGSIKQGMSAIYQAAVSKFSATYRGNWDLKSTEEALSEGILCRFGERTAINPSLLESDLAGLADQIISWIRQRWEGEKLNRMICTGGGSSHLKPYLIRTFPRMIFMDDPQQANVRGFYKGARYYDEA
ncbi:ParM/StbA family protein [Candidatus Manganitrophus noduliformans]|uniref:ParM/StbA family protein n=1 Tax=Candidatus Manganitrophus noduliformans TaxID=2606439 RepID=A0A7X6DT10_9BACT|nr:ParM/StbA family protein [Candidatus Manganitrophus noduliformans]NKE72856.1 ParM/StbA family protein [Candidatus Manganitrophus noduliformans]